MNVPMINEKQSLEEKKSDLSSLQTAKVHVAAGAFSPSPFHRKSIKGDALSKEKESSQVPPSPFSDDNDDSEDEVDPIDPQTTTLSADEQLTIAQENRHPLRGLLKSPGGRKSARSLRRESIEDISKALLLKKEMSQRGVTFRDEVETKDISRLRKSAIEELFYNSTDMADFRTEAFLEECGLDPSEFM